MKGRGYILALSCLILPSISSQTRGPFTGAQQRLRVQRLRELELAGDAASRCWEREVGRHRCAATCIEQLLDELNEPLEESENAGG